MSIERKEAFKPGGEAGKSPPRPTPMNRRMEVTDMRRLDIRRFKDKGRGGFGRLRQWLDAIWC